MTGSMLHVRSGRVSAAGGRWVRTVGDYDGVVALNGFVCHGFREVDGEQDRVHLAAERIEGGLEKYCLQSALRQTLI